VVSVRKFLSRMGESRTVQTETESESFVAGR
jgi:hypothetical protein